MDATLSVKDLETSLTEVLDRVRGGERFVIERDGEVIATLTPPPPKPGRTWGEFLALVRSAPRPDPDFTDDLEAIQAAQPPMPDPPAWPD